MEVRESSAKYLLQPGYKQTDVGTVPSDWTCPSLDSLVSPGCSITYGIVQAGPHIVDGIPYIKTGDMSGHALPTDGLSKTSKEIAARFPRSMVRADELVYSIRASVGAVHRVPPELDGANLTQGTARIAPKPEVSGAYLLYALRSAACQNWVDRNSKGSTYKEITLETLRELSVPIPPSRREQDAIAEALSDADALIESLEQLLAKKRHIKQGAMQELLTGKKRLPGFSAVWEVNPLSGIATATKGNQLGESAWNEHGAFAHLNGGTSPSGYTDNWNSSGDTIAISEGGNSCGYVQFMPEPFWAGGHCYSVRPTKIDNRFLYHVLKGQEQSIMALRVGSGLPNVQKTALLALELHSPRCAAEQTALATILSDMDAELAALEAKLTKARQIKQAMMQALLTGRIRLV